MRQRFPLAFSLMFGLAACTAATSPGGGSGGSGGSGSGGAGGTGARGGSAAGSGGSTGGTTGGSAGGSAGAGSGGAGGSSATGGAGGSGGSAGSGGSGGAGGAGGSGGSGGAGGSGGSSADAVTGTEGGSNTEVPPATGNLCAGAKKCFDFEDQTAGMPPSSPEFTVQTTGGTIAVDTTKFFSGGKSILIKTRGGTNFPGTNLVFNNIQTLLPQNEMYGRVMMWMANTPGQAHWDSILGSAANGANPTYILGGMYGNFMSVYHPGDDSVDSATKFPTGRWACIQWQFSGKGGMNLHKMMLDGTVVDKGNTTKWRAPTFAQLKVGYRHFNTNVAVDVWLDDLAFGDQPIACPPPKP